MFAPSLLSADFGHLSEGARIAEEAGAEYLHFDVMDGLFVPNITFGAEMVRALRPHCALPFDVHLMIQDPGRYIESFVEAGADILTVHAEACVHLQRVLASIRECGARAGLALNPATPLSVLDHVIPDVDLVLIMTVNPGFGGQKFIPQMLDKILETRRRLDAANSSALIEVDGGISARTIAPVAAAGATLFVAGSAVYGHPHSPSAAIAEMRAAVAASDRA